MNGKKTKENKNNLTTKTEKMRKIVGLLIILQLGTTLSIEAQQKERYLQEIFDISEIKVKKEQTYSININWLLSDFTNQAGVKVELTELKTIAATGGDYPLKYYTPNHNGTPPGDETSIKISKQTMDIYMPENDSEKSRPLIVIAHSGNFLPKGINKQPSGNKNDSSIAEFSRQFAKRGYVVAAINYRVGWNPISTELDTRRGTLLSAVYRSVHDVKQAVRVLRMSVKQGNPYYIDPEKVAIFGQGSGAYTALAYGSLDKTSELALPIFLDKNGDSYINQELVGGIDGFGGIANLYVDTFSTEGITSDVKLTLNAGGALANINWVEKGEPAIVSVNTIRDPFAPFDTGTVIVTGTGLNVIDVNGSGTFMRRVNALGNNDAFLNNWSQDPYTTTARSRYGKTYEYIYANRPTITLLKNIDGVFPILIPKAKSVFENTSGPWEWWSLADLIALQNAYAAQGIIIDAKEIDENTLKNNSKGHDKSSALAYIDTVQNYMSRRIMRVLEIGNWKVLSVPELRNDRTIDFMMGPNPANDILNLTSKDNTIISVQIYDIMGKSIYHRKTLANSLQINVSDFTPGVYVTEVTTPDGRNVKKLIIE